LYLVYKNLFKNFVNYFAGVDVGVLDKVAVEVAGG